ncbi:PP2C family protein-serine/threonine phosphatase [Streptomyces sp. NPDC058650]|uniref:PP2C family protein-serine/threonine phosphatase n=1 Tax=Streptomyces sp. NPDC058650 TaxID=3346575 RepID=UPI002FB496D6
MTQIGNGNARHRITLPDGTEVTLAWAAVTDTGLRREVNEDSFIAQAPVFAVADGMGGHAAGDFASAAVVTRLAEHGGKTLVGTPEIDHALRLAVQDMGRGAGVTDEGSGTTVTGAALGAIADEPAWIVFNIGDSRVYRLVGGVLEQLTVDHSIVQELVDAGQITREEADTHPHSNVITRAVGFHEAPIPDYRAIAVEPGMRLLICSDGLTKELTTYGIRHFLVANAKAEKAAHQLLEAALGNGGRDNVTAIVVDVLKVVRPAGAQSSDEVEPARS